MLQVDGLSVAYGAAQVTHGVSFCVRSGETLAIVGESGSGKSTTATAALGLLPRAGRVQGGRIVFGGRDLLRLSSRELRAVRGRDIGYIPQDPMSNLNPAWPVGFQIAETLRAHGAAGGKAARERAVELLDEVGVPDPARRAKQYQHELSGGMRQRVLIAMALSCRPKLIVADEPTSALDVTVARRILDLIAEMQEKLGAAVLLITHDLGLAAERANEVVVMRKGRVVESGPSATVLAQPGHSYTRALLAAAPGLNVRSAAAHCIASPDTPGIATETLVQSAEPGAPLLEATGLRKVYQLPGRLPWQKTPFTAVNGVSFTVRRAQTLAVVGESGSGKSTLGRMTLGLEHPTEGGVLFDGKSVFAADRQGQLALRRRMQVVFQDPYGSLDPMHTVGAAVEESLKTHRIGDKKTRQRLVAEAFDSVRLSKSMLGRFPNELSGGQRQRVAIARALVLSPELIVCDEAVSALDVLVQAQVLDLLQALQEERGISYLFITHDLAVVRQIADEVLVMRQGAAVEHAPVAEIFENPREEYTQRLLSAIPGHKLARR
ncbi:ABC transporter related protein [Segniliparus rotundus DSM 44985]|uniref:ABC transporter related protein n=1 Tax=Segniliparus rotundus (strain ATCC BAA-972 / CDC 1076 / CIP 108378 / DSM 44985 / JCM 13578) TaxID=640132 RepID=D6ZF71_SEGRD|nr:ABC transporter related protein [Segniliparus rotundus DSM 44985]